MKFNDLREVTKKKYACGLAHKHSLEELLLAAEAAAYQDGIHATKKILKLLRNGGEKWAKDVVRNLASQKPTSRPSMEQSLMLKTRLSLSKNKYRGVARFLRQEMGQKLVSWENMIKHRNEIIPKFPKPNETKGYLAVTVSVRDLVMKDVERILELEEVKRNLSCVASSGVVDCLMHVSAGIVCLSSIT